MLQFMLFSIYFYEVDVMCSHCTQKCNCTTGTKQHLNYFQSLIKKYFSHCHVNVIHMCIIAFCIHVSIIACCLYLTCSSVCNYSHILCFLLHIVLFPSVLNIIHVFDLESVCLISNIYIIMYYS